MTTLNQALEESAAAAQTAAPFSPADILADLGTLRQASGKRTPLLIGFAAETENLLDNARKKLNSKRADAIVLNDVSRSDIGFNSDRNEVTIVTAKQTIAVPEADKLEIAQKILRAVAGLRPAMVQSTSTTV